MGSAPCQFGECSPPSSRVASSLQDAPHRFAQCGVACFALWTQQMNSFRPRGVRLPHKPRTIGSMRTAASRSSPAWWTEPWGKSFMIPPGNAIQCPGPIGDGSGGSFDAGRFFKDCPPMGQFSLLDGRNRPARRGWGEQIGISSNAEEQSCHHGMATALGRPCERLDYRPANHRAKLPISGRSSWLMR